jgi:hypothetical protein
MRMPICLRCEKECVHQAHSVSGGYLCGPCKKSVDAQAEAMRQERLSTLKDLQETDT